MNILVVQNHDRAPIGSLGDALRRRGATLTTWQPLHQTPCPTGEYAGLIILGGYMNAYEDDQFPHLRQVVEQIRQFYAANKPIMGICLGAQLIARAFDCPVYPAPTPELGFSAVRVVDGPSPEPWLRTLPADFKLMHWHFDTFDLPQEATLLMTNEVCANQAYRIGSNVYGFQFHLEITAAIAHQWLIHARGNNWITTHHPDIEAQVTEQLTAYGPTSRQFTDAVAQDWLNQVHQGLHHWVQSA
ncbi:MAG: type 1 glutamine amidotransferase [Leptolyngbyaceae bacterium]|nr:type 1 glutamine amidotransferase [Leptolyngbyaceae bacterium]